MNQQCIEGGITNINRGLDFPLKFKIKLNMHSKYMSRTKLNWIEMWTIYDCKFVNGEIYFFTKRTINNEIQNQT